MLVTITLHIRIPKRSGAAIVATAIAHLPDRSPYDEPRFVTPLNPRPGRTADDVFCRIRPLQRTPLSLDAPAWFFDLERQQDAQGLVLETVRDAVRARKTART